MMNGRNNSHNNYMLTTSVRYATKCDCISLFSPEIHNITTEKWLFKIEQLAVSNGLDEKQMIVHMQNRFSGLAKQWFNNLTSYDFCWGE